jgi:hypothetical protein
MSFEPVTVKQAALIMAVVVILWVPMTTFLLLFSQTYSPRQIGVVALINMLISVPLLILIYRRWISKVQ